jgi:hypothetical protein
MVTSVIGAAPAAPQIEHPCRPVAERAVFTICDIHALNDVVIACEGDGKAPITKFHVSHEHPTDTTSVGLSVGAYAFETITSNPMLAPQHEPRADGPDLFTVFYGRS